MPGLISDLVKSYTTVAVNIPAGASTLIIAAPAAGKQIWVMGGLFILDVDGTVTFEDEDAVKLSGAMLPAGTGGFTLPITPDWEKPWIKCTTAKALHILTETCTVDGMIGYAIASAD